MIITILRFAEALLFKRNDNDHSGQWTPSFWAAVFKRQP